jgi:hypothetical protein
LRIKLPTCEKLLSQQLGYYYKYKTQSVFCIFILQYVQILKNFKSETAELLFSKINKIFSKEVPIINPPWLASYQTEGTYLEQEFRV